MFYPGKHPCILQKDLYFAVWGGSFYRRHLGLVGWLCCINLINLLSFCLVVLSAVVWVKYPPKAYVLKSWSSTVALLRDGETFKRWSLVGNLLVLCGILGPWPLPFLSLLLSFHEVSRLLDYTFSPCLLRLKSQGKIVTGWNLLTVNGSKPFFKLIYLSKIENLCSNIAPFIPHAPWYYHHRC